MTSSSFSILVSSIVEGPRARDTTKYGDIDALAQSLKRLGTIQPIVLSRRQILLHEGVETVLTYDLVAGGRRFRAIQSLGITELWHGSTLDPEKLGFVFSHEVPEDVRAEAELEENLRRLSMDWIDETLTVADLHAKKSRARVKWTMKETAAILGYSTHAMVSIHCAAAKLLRAGDTEVRECRDISSVVALLARRKEEEGLAELQRRVAEKFKTKGGDASVPTNSGPSPEMAIGEVPSSPIASEAIPSVSVPLSSMFTVGDSITLMSALPAASFNHIVTDIPYGIDMDNLDAENVKSTVEEHSVEDNVRLMVPFLEQSFRLLKPHGFCCFFFDLDYLQYLQSIAKNVGFRVQRWPIIIHKTSTCRNTCAQYNTTKNYEALLYLRRDEHTVLRRAVASSVRSYDFKAERSQYNHPFYKPSAAWNEIYDDIAFAGQSVLDPFCGEMSGARAAVAKGLVPTGMDLNGAHILRGMEHVKDAYRKLLAPAEVQFS